MSEPTPSVPASKLAIGTMNFGKRTGRAESRRIVSRALDLGLTFFDTANAYNDGDAERILGEALAGRRDSVQIATKVGFGRVNGAAEGLSAERVRSALDESLRRLGTGYVDVYYLHVPDPKVPVDETLDAVHTILQSGKARAWGISNYASWQVLEMMHVADARGLARPVLGQQLYNVLLRELDIEWFAFAKRYGVHTTVYNPLAGGLLSGKHRPEGESGELAGRPPTGSRFDKNALYQRRYWTKRMFERVRALAEVAARESLTVLELAYAWVAQRPGVDSILVGPASVDHLDAAVAAVGKSLSKETLDAVEALDREARGSDAHYVR